jgi:MFS superfamily sulfate permease-like transporter
MSRKLLPGLSRQNVGSEALAGVTLLAIAVPLNIGYAQIAGLPPTAGLYALVLPAVLYALTVSSRQLVASPDAAAAALVASSVGGLAAAGSQSYVALALAQAIISGVLFVAFGLLKLGFDANFLPKPILIVGGLALDILVSQVAKMLGVKIDSGGEFLEKLGDLVTGLPKLSLVSLLLAPARGRRGRRARRWSSHRRQGAVGAHRARRRHGCHGPGAPRRPRRRSAGGGARRTADLHVAGPRPQPVVHHRPVRHRPDSGDDSRGTARLAQLQRAAGISDRREPRARRLRPRPRQPHPTRGEPRRRRARHDRGPGPAPPVLGDATESEPGVIVVRFSAPIFFANVGLLRDRVHAVVEAAQVAPSGASDGAGAPAVRHLVLDMEGVTDIDVTGADGLEQLRSWLQGRGTQVHYSRVRPAVADRLHHFGLDERSAMFGTNRAALEELRAR